MYDSEIKVNCAPLLDYPPYYSVGRVAAQMQ